MFPKRLINSSSPELVGRTYGGSLRIVNIRIKQIIWKGHTRKITVVATLAEKMTAK